MPEICDHSMRRYVLEIQEVNLASGTATCLCNSGCLGFWVLFLFCLGFSSSLPKIALLLLLKKDEIINLHHKQLLAFPVVDSSLTAAQS